MYCSVRDLLCARRANAVAGSPPGVAACTRCAVQVASLLPVLRHALLDVIGAACCTHRVRRGAVQVRGALRGSQPGNGNRSRPMGRGRICR